nr:MAG TPA: adenine-specific methyltransferase [Caudoviricetes sp.]
MIKSLVVSKADILAGLWALFPVINVDRVKDIPCDYPGAMGVPITIFDKLCRKQFAVLDCVHHVQLENGRHPYRRVVIRNLRPELPDEIDLCKYFCRMGFEIDFAKGDCHDT